MAQEQVIKLNKRTLIILFIIGCVEALRFFIEIVFTPFQQWRWVMLLDIITIFLLLTIASGTLRTNNVLWNLYYRGKEIMNLAFEVNKKLEEKNESKNRKRRN